MLRRGDEHGTWRVPRCCLGSWQPVLVPLSTCSASAYLPFTNHEVLEDGDSGLTVKTEHLGSIWPADMAKRAVRNATATPETFVRQRVQKE